MNLPDPHKRPRAASAAASLERLDKLAVLLDSQFKIPGTGFGVGLDGLVGLIPGIGDLVMLVPQLYLVLEARRLRLGWGVIVRMLLNLALDWLIGLVPVVGDFFDIVFKANLRNMKLVRRAIEKRATTPS